MLLTSLPLFSTIVLFLVFSSNAKPFVVRDNLIRLPFAKKVNITSPRQLVTHDQARAAAFFNRRYDNVAGPGMRRQDVPAIDSGTYYAATVSIGTPGTSCESEILKCVNRLLTLFEQDSLLIDTGSSNTFVGTNKPYQTSSSSVSTGHKEVCYLSTNDPCKYIIMIFSR